MISSIIVLTVWYSFVLRDKWRDQEGNKNSHFRSEFGAYTFIQNYEWRQKAGLGVCGYYGKGAFVRLFVGIQLYYIAGSFPSFFNNIIDYVMHLI